MEKAEEYLSRIPLHAKKKHSLEEVRAVLEILGNPNRDKPWIHVAGTNGKGSVCAFLTSVLRQAGCRTGTFVSPHLENIRERFLINGEMVREPVFERGFEEILGALSGMKDAGAGHPSYFEFLFYMAMVIFREENVDVMVIETGMGGRLDATNALENPSASVITSVSMDHMEYLGDTLEKIAREKAGIIRAGTPVIFDASNPRVRAEIEGAAFRKGAARYPVCEEDCRAELLKEGCIKAAARLLDGRRFPLTIPFEAFYQTKNAMLALRTLEVLRGTGYRGIGSLPAGESRDVFGPITDGQIAEGIRLAAWPGRMEQVRPGLYLDGANNPEGAAAFLRTAAEIAKRRGERSFLLFGALSDKDYETMIRILAKGYAWDGVGVVSVKSARGASAERLAEAFEKWGVHPAGIYRDVKEALPDMERMAEGGLIFCTGSLYLVGEIRSGLGAKTAGR